jgi:hypothetical protein
MLKQLSKIKKVIIGTVVITASLVAILNTSDLWLVKLWDNPFDFRQQHPFQFPPNLDLRVKITDVEDQDFPYSEAYVKTDIFGALGGVRNAEPASLLVGSSLAANIFIKPEKRWSNLVKQQLRNFGVPGTSNQIIKGVLEKLIQEKSVSFEQVVFIPNLSLKMTKMAGTPIGSFLGKPEDYTLFSEPISKHLLLQYLFMSRGVIPATVESLYLNGKDPVETPNRELFKKEYQENLKLNLNQEIAAISELLEAHRKKLVLLTSPSPERENKKWPKMWRKESMRSISLSQLHFVRENLNQEILLQGKRRGTKVLDISKCMNAYEEKGLFWPQAELSEVGNQVFANCFNLLISE